MHCSGPVLFGRIAPHRHYHRFVSLDSREKRTVRIAFESEERVRGPATLSPSLYFYSTVQRIHIQREYIFINKFHYCVIATTVRHS